MKHIKLFEEENEEFPSSNPAEYAKLEAEYDKLSDEAEELFQKTPMGLKPDEFEKWYSENVTPANKKVSAISRKMRLIAPYKLGKIPDYGDVMTLKQFIGNVKSGGFMDYDGFGRYVKGDKESNIDIYPSDILKNEYRKDFDKIVWFNR